ncbi:MAG TPA: heme o synthase [Candidatus Binatia bacterium]|nr:heme o synthase [Candidatus Binatia bacterium]
MRTQQLERSVAIAAQPARVADYVELTKPRITTMVVVSAAAGYYLGSDASVDVVRLLHAMAGTALIASGASCLNQVLERDSDARMDRTRSRPLPAGRLDFLPALGFGAALSLLGAAQLAAAVNPLTAVLGVLTLALYVAVYTPLKRLTSLCTIIGAVPGALPPVMGWTAARDALSAEAWVLFAILFFWQMPHFLAIAAAYRDDYARGGHVVLPVIDGDGASTARQTMLYLFALIPVSLLPSVLHMSGTVYFWGALALGAGFLAVGMHAARDRSIPAERRLLRYSVLYLPALLALMTVDKVAA